MFGRKFDVRPRPFRVPRQEPLVIVIVCIYLSTLQYLWLKSETRLKTNVKVSLLFKTGSFRTKPVTILCLCVNGYLKEVKLFSKLYQKTQLWIAIVLNIWLFYLFKTYAPKNYWKIALFWIWRSKYWFCPVFDLL